MNVIESFGIVVIIGFVFWVILRIYNSKKQDALHESKDDNNVDGEVKNGN